MFFPKRGFRACGLQKFCFPLKEFKISREAKNQDCCASYSVPTQGNDVEGVEGKKRYDVARTEEGNDVGDVKKRVSRPRQHRTTIRPSDERSNGPRQGDVAFARPPRGFLPRLALISCCFCTHCVL